jgi:hypothetical protein
MCPPVQNLQSMALDADRTFVTGKAFGFVSGSLADGGLGVINESLRHRDHLGPLLWMPFQLYYQKLKAGS